MYLYYAALAFKIWMAVDCVRRGAEGYWIWVVLLLPFGDWVYFFAVKVHDFRGRFSFDERPKSLDELRRRYQTTPSELNRLSYAEALARSGDHAEAATHFAEIVQRNPAALQARLGLARALRERGEHAGAAEHYHELLERNPRYDDYRAALEYAELCWESNRREEALELLEELARASGRLNHRMALAHYTNLDGSRERAVQILRHALEQHDDSPQFVRRRDRQLSGEARRMLKELEGGR